MAGFDFDSRSGLDEGEKAVKEKAAANAFPRTHWFDLDDGESIILRFLTEYGKDVTPGVIPWPFVLQHQYCFTRPKPDDYKGNWPESMGAVCRKDPLFGGSYPDCFLCEHGTTKYGKSKTQIRYWSLAVVREEVIENGKIAGYRDARRDVAEMKDGKPTGTTTEERAIIVVNQPSQTFFSALGEMGRRYGTVMDRDYYIKRKGADKDTQYSIIPLDPIPGYDMRDPEIRARYGTLPDLRQMVVDRSTDDYFARFFDIRVPQPASKTSVEESDTPNAPKEDTEATTAKAAAFRDRLTQLPDAPATPTESQPESQPGSQPEAVASAPRAFD